MKTFILEQTPGSNFGKDIIIGKRKQMFFLFFILVKISLYDN
jgi:hypothetical protein